MRCYENTIAFNELDLIDGDDSSILYYQSNHIEKEDTVIKIIVKELPKYISIDPFGTRSDENFTDNLLDL